MFSHAMNVVVGAKEDRQLTIGLHKVADIYCSDCREVLGWKYERAYEETQKYKESSYLRSQRLSKKTGSVQIVTQQTFW
jgi:hypothetical protein